MNNEHGILGGLIRWFSQPFQSGGSAINWVLFVGLIIIAIWMWQTVLIKLEGVTTTVGTA